MFHLYAYTGLYVSCKTRPYNSKETFLDLHAWSILGNVKANERDPKSHLAKVFGFKLKCLSVMHDLKGYDHI
jgi:hypothetical protein